MRPFNTPVGPLQYFGNEADMGSNMIIKSLLDPQSDYDSSVHGISSVFDPWIIESGSG